MKHKIYILCALVSASTSCGQFSDDDSSDSTASTEAKTTTTPLADSASTTAISLRGYVANAFEVTVDGASYADLEDFYTKELDKLPEKVQAAGYANNWNVRFEAQIGFEDLWENMKVYVAPVDTRGYQAEARVSRNGEFIADLPSDANESSYKIRANKRISVLLSRDGEQERICYNFSAIDKSVVLSSEDKPVMLSDFVTTLTRYACETLEGDGLTIPSSQQTPEPPRFPISVGMTKAQVLESFGTENLLVESDTKWCWYSSSVGAADLCAVNYATACQCYISFDDDGLVTDQWNLKSTYLDVLSW